MAQIFPRWLNWFALGAAVVSSTAGAMAVAAVWYFGSPQFTDVGYRPVQPVLYSHALHAGELGIDCRYCHFSVEASPVATIPPTQTCMNCHHVAARDSELLAPIRESMAKNKPMRWVRVHNLPDYAFFNHASHIRVGVGCASCHGEIHKMEVVTQVQPLSMGWCLDCHRNPGQHLRPLDQVTNMDWFPAKDHAAFAANVIAEKGIAPPTDCSGCHR